MRFIAYAFVETRACARAYINRAAMGHARCLLSGAPTERPYEF